IPIEIRGDKVNVPNSRRAEISPAQSYNRSRGADGKENGPGAASARPWVDHSDRSGAVLGNVFGRDAGGQSTFVDKVSGERVAIPLDRGNGNKASAIDGQDESRSTRDYCIGHQWLINQRHRVLGP